MTEQEKLVLHQKRMAVKMASDARTNIDNRASALLQAGGLVLVLVSVVKLPAFVLQPTPIAKIGIAIALLTFAGMLIFTLLSLMPRAYAAPTTRDWDTLQQRYLLVDETTCFDQVLADVLGAIDSLEAINKRKALYLKLSMLLFLLQIVGLLALALTA